jgi:hypothetical protein
LLKPKEAIMRKTLLAGAIAGVVISPLSHADVYDARAMARGGTGMTMGEYNQALYNPAMINRFDENDEFSFALNGGIIASDQDGFIEGAEDFQDLIDEVERYVDANGPYPEPERTEKVDELEQSLINISDTLVQIEAGGATMIAIPNSKLPLAFVGKAKASIGTAFSYDSADRQVLEDIASGVPGADQDDLVSDVNASLLWIAEYGLMMGKGFNLAGLQIDGGATLKAQTIELVAYQDTVANFDAGDISDSGNLESHSALNVDLGVSTRLGEEGRLILAGTIENFIPQSFDGPNNSEYEMEPVLTAAAGYNGTRFKAEFNMDLTQRNGYDLLQDTQFARAGIELSAGRHFHLRAGYRTDIKSNVSDLLTAGIGITPWDRFNIDLSGGVGEGDTYAAALQLGFKI